MYMRMTLHGTDFVTASISILSFNLEWCRNALE